MDVVLVMIRRWRGCPLAWLFVCVDVGGEVAVAVWRLRGCAAVSALLQSSLLLPLIDSLPASGKPVEPGQGWL